MKIESVQPNQVYRSGSGHLYFVKDKRQVGKIFQLKLRASGSQNEGWVTFEPGTDLDIWIPAPGSRTRHQIA